MEKCTKNVLHIILGKTSQTRHLHCLNLVFFQNGKRKNGVQKNQPCFCHIPTFNQKSQLYFFLVLLQKIVVKESVNKKPTSASEATAAAKKAAKKKMQRKPKLSSFETNHKLIKNFALLSSLL